MNIFRKFIANVRNAPAKAVSQPGNLHHSFRSGDTIGLAFHVFGALGKGGFGVVLKVYDNETKEVCALKTFREELLADPEARATFQREASNWINLGQHPFILTARSVREISGRLFVKMDYIPPDEHGCVTLLDHLLIKSHPIGAERTLEWAIQFCLAMEHAQKHGVQCHRDIKPQNILVASGTTLKLSDFGLALVAQAQESLNSPGTASTGENQASLSVVSLEGRKICGTPGYMAPEIFRGQGADIRSDIYSFGLVLWQMAAMSPVPPFADYLRQDLHAYLKTVYETQMAATPPPTGQPVDAVIEKCLRKNPHDRFASVGEVREQLEILLWNLAGRKVKIPDPGEQNVSTLCERGISLHSVGRFEEALATFDQAALLDTENAEILMSRGACLCSLGRYEEGIRCYDASLQVAPQDARAHFNKANALETRGRAVEALSCYDEAVKLAPWYYKAWAARAGALYGSGKFKEALASYDRSLEIYPKDTRTWNGKAAVLEKLGRKEEALACYDQAIQIDPIYYIARLNKAYALSRDSRFHEAILCCEACLEIDPRLVAAWVEKARNLFLLERDDESSACYEQALTIDPQSARAWHGKASLAEARGQLREAGRCLSIFIEVATPADQAQVPAAMERLRKLGGKIAA